MIHNPKNGFIVMYIPVWDSLSEPQMVGHWVTYWLSYWVAGIKHGWVMGESLPSSPTLPWAADY